MPSGRAVIGVANAVSVLAGGVGVPVIRVINTRDGAEFMDKGFAPRTEPFRLNKVEAPATAVAER